MAANLREAHDALDRQVEQERKMRETLQSLQRQVVRQERLAAVGLLVSGVAHELNNPLQAILGTAELLEREPDLSREALDEIALRQDAERPRARDHPQPVALQQPAVGPADARRSARRHRRGRAAAPAAISSNSSIALDVDAPTDAAGLRELHRARAGDAELRHQRAAGDRGGRPARRAASSSALFDAGKKVRLEVHDDGPGVSPEDEPKLFQPFFTTKPVGKGTGLGLSVSYGIIESYGGDDRLPRQRLGRRDVLLRAAGRRSAVRRRDTRDR